MDDSTFAPGFRFSPLDAVVLTIGTIATIGVGMIVDWLGVAIAFVVIHFFLFCNVLRMSRPFEMLWAAIFTLLAGLAIVEVITWPIAFGVSLLITLLVAVLEMRRQSYHGVAWKSVNPHLLEWWKTRTSRGGG